MALTYKKLYCIISLVKWSIGLVKDHQKAKSSQCCEIERGIPMGWVHAEKKLCIALLMEFATLIFAVRRSTDFLPGQKSNGRQHLAALASPREQKQALRQLQRFLHMSTLHSRFTVCLLANRSLHMVPAAHKYLTPPQGLILRLAHIKFGMAMIIGLEEPVLANTLHVASMWHSFEMPHRSVINF